MSFRVYNFETVTITSVLGGVIWNLNFCVYYHYLGFGGVMIKAPSKGKCIWA